MKGRKKEKLYRIIATDIIRKLTKDNFKLNYKQLFNSENIPPELYQVLRKAILEMLFAFDISITVNFKNKEDENAFNKLLSDTNKEETESWGKTIVKEDKNAFVKNT